MLKKLIPILLVFSVILCFVSCKNSKNSDTDTTRKIEKTNLKAENSKSYKFFEENFNSGEYTLTLSTKNGENSEIITIGINKEGVIYEDEITGEAHETTISVNGIRTVIIHHAQAYYTENYDASSVQPELFNAKDFVGKLYSSGTEIVDGKEYYLEQFSDEYGTLSYLFDGDNLAYMVKVTDEKSIYIQISDLKHSFNESLINVPPTYELLDY